MSGAHKRVAGWGSAGNRFITAGVAMVGLLGPGLLLMAGGCLPQPASPPSPALPAPVEAPPKAASVTFPRLAAVSREQRAKYLGGKACLACHPRHAEQLQTHHAHTLALPTARLGRIFSRSQSVHDGQLGVSFSPFLHDQRMGVRASQGGSAEEATVEVVFGSGNRCMTFVGSYDEQPVELRLSFYREADRWDFTPGHEVGNPISAPMGRLLAPDRVEACMVCHSTAAVIRDGRPVLTGATGSLLGVTCETCHGPGRDHVEAAKSHAADLRMARFSQQAERVTVELCGQCHRTEQATGDPHNPGTASQLPRFQGVALAQSECFKKSAGKLSCVTCHNPHRNAADTTRSEYNRICASCHTPSAPSRGIAAPVACKVEPKGDCIPCHMPAQPVAMPTNLKYRNHWIKAWQKPARR